MPASSRDDFKQTVKDEVSRRAGNKCSNPDCRKVTTGPTSTPSGIISIGVACHIKAASPGGPRYDNLQSSEERASPENAIWLCADCARLIDSDVAQYPPEKLQAWKKRQEEWVRASIGRSDQEPITEVAGNHIARGSGNITALDIEGSAIIRPGTRSLAEGEGNVTATRIGPRGKR